MTKNQKIWTLTSLYGTELEETSVHLSREAAWEKIWETVKASENSPDEEQVEEWKQEFEGQDDFWIEDVRYEFAIDSHEIEGVSLMAHDKLDKAMTLLKLASEYVGAGEQFTQLAMIPSFGREAGIAL